MIRPGQLLEGFVLNNLLDVRVRPGKFCAAVRVKGEFNRWLALFVLGYCSDSHDSHRPTVRSGAPV